MKKLQPKDIEKYFDSKGWRNYDEYGWTGEYVVSVKNILDMLIDLNILSERQQIIKSNEQHKTKALSIADVSKRLLFDLRKHYLVEIDFNKGTPRADMQTLMKLWDEVNDF